MTVSEWHKIENDGDPWQSTCWLQMAHNDDDILICQEWVDIGDMVETWRVNLTKVKYIRKRLPKFQVVKDYQQIIYTDQLLGDLHNCHILYVNKNRRVKRESTYFPFFEK